MAVSTGLALPSNAVSARVCETLQEAREAPLFYEALFDFAQKRIPFGDGYEAWRRERDALMRDGRELYFAGPWSTKRAEPSDDVVGDS